MCIDIIIALIPVFIFIFIESYSTKIRVMKGDLATDAAALSVLTDRSKVNSEKHNEERNIFHTEQVPLMSL